MLTIVKHLLPLFVRSLLFFQEAKNELGSVVPGREVGQVRSDHLGGIIELLFGHAGSSDLLEIFDYRPTIPPAMEVAAVSSQHLSNQAKFFLP